MAGCPEAWHEEREGEGGRVCGALVTLESPENRKIFRVRLLFPMKCQDVAAAPSHFHTVVQHNGTIAAGSLFCCCALFIISTTILNLRKIKIHLWNKSFLFFSILCLKLMFVIVPVKSLQRPITSALVKEGMSPHLYKQSKAFHFSLAK